MARVLGGALYETSVTPARQGTPVDGAGTAAALLVLYGSTVSNPASGSTGFNRGSHAPSARNINTADSVVNRDGDTAPMTAFTWHGGPCPHGAAPWSPHRWAFRAPAPLPPSRQPCLHGPSPQG